MTVGAFYVELIFVLAAPFVFSIILLALIISGFRSVRTGFRRDGRIDIVGILAMFSGIIGGAIFYQWLRGPTAELANLQPLIIDPRLAHSLPSTWVISWGGAKQNADNAANAEAHKPYLKLEHVDDGDAQILNFTLVAEGGAKLIARCVGRAPKETNPVLASIRGDRSLEVASSIYKCRMRAAAGALSRAIATGTPS